MICIRYYRRASSAHIESPKIRPMVIVWMHIICWFRHQRNIYYIQTRQNTYIHDATNFNVPEIFNAYKQTHEISCYHDYMSKCCNQKVLSRGLLLELNC